MRSAWSSPRARSSTASAPAGVVGGLSTSALIRKARDDDRIKAIVLRVNSPGGSVFGSELVRRELELARAAGKPVVVSMGDLAASGGYWISTSADEVIADAGTVTGSIGVFGLLPTADKALDKLGVHADGVTTTWLGGARDMRRPLDPRFGDLVQSSIDHIYADFTAKVAQARKTTPEKIDAVAQGRVWTGAQALERGLVDRLGSYGDALDSAATRAKLDREYRVVYLERDPGRVARLVEMFNATLGPSRRRELRDEPRRPRRAGARGRRPRTRRRRPARRRHREASIRGRRALPLRSALSEPRRAMAAEPRPAASLNAAQMEAVQHLGGPCLVLAGAGSGKTRVITHKIARLLQADYLPKQIAAITFTNKAAQEMRERAKALVGPRAAKDLAISTFHSLGVRILRSHGERVGLKPQFSILDSDDVLGILRDAGGCTDNALARRWQWTISRWKNDGLNSEQADAVAADDDERVAARVMKRYEERLAAYQAVDFDDLIGLPHRLLQRDAEVREKLQDQLRYVLVDEYQDTNAIQYELLKLLAGERGLFTAVGDDDQSIYGWRGATIDNLKRLPAGLPAPEGDRARAELPLDRAASCAPRTA